MAGDSSFAYKTLIFALVISLTMPLMITAFIPSAEVETENNVLDDYYRFTGQQASHTKEAVWVLRGIYTPYEGGLYNYTEDGWIYGARINSYSPTQYQNGLFAYTVTRDNDTNMYKYTDMGTGGTADYDEEKGTGHKAGDLYTNVVFDKDHKSNIFFTKNTKYNRDGTAYIDGSGQPFYYEFTGWRYSFSPLANYNGVDAEGNPQRIIATTTSLSLIWYEYYTANGLAGQLILSGSDQGVAYLTGDQIVRAFDSTTSTARFSMVFNGVEMGIYIRIDPYALANDGKTVQDCYNEGLWSIMVTSISTDADAYSGTDYDLNIWRIFETLTKLMTFDYRALGMDAFMGAICSFVIIIPLYASLISLAMGSWLSMAVVGIFAAVQGIATAITHFGSWFGGSSQIIGMILSLLSSTGLS